MSDALLREGRRVARDGVDDRELSFAELVAVLYRRRLLLLAGVLLGGAAGVGLVAAMPPTFTAQALILLGPTPGAAGTAALDGGVVDSQAQVLGSRSLAREAIARLGLEADPELLGTPGDGSPRALLVRLAGQAEAGAVEPTSDPAATSPAAVDVDVDVVGRFLERLAVRREGKSYVVAVAYRSADPGKAARVPNALAELYLDGQEALRREAAERADGALAGQRDLVLARLEAAEAKLGAFRDRAGAARGGAAGVEADEVGELSRQLVLAGADLSARETRLRQIRTDVAAGEDGAASDAGASVLLQNLSALKAQLLRREAELAGQYGGRHPKLVDVRSERAELEARIAQERKAQLRGLEGEVEAARAKERALARSLGELKGRAIRQDEAARDAAALEQDVAVNQRLYETLLERANAGIGPRGDGGRSVGEPEARVISEAVAPTTATFPRPRLVTSLGATVGLALALALVYLLESRDRGFRSAREIRTVLDLPTVALVPELGRARGAAAVSPPAYALERPRSRYAEALREILASLLTGPAGDGVAPKVVLVTSVLPDEGKSTLTLSLGRLAAAEGLKVLVVDADLRRPSLHTLAGLKPGPGLVELLKGEAPLGEVVRADPRSDLRILAGSGRLTQPARLFTPEKAGRLLAEVRAGFDLVLVDAAPLAAVADPKLLAPLVDRVFLVVRHGSTRRELCAHCLAGLRATGATLGGVILSRVDLRRHREAGAGDAGYAYARLAHYYAD